MNMQERLNRRKRRIRYNLKKKNPGKLRLTVFKSNNYIYAQIIDDVQSVTLVQASSLEKDMRNKHANLNLTCAKEVGLLLGKRAKEKNIAEVVFDRSGYVYHGKIKVLADAAREAGLKF